MSYHLIEKVFFNRKDGLILYFNSLEKISINTMYSLIFNSREYYFETKSITTTSDINVVKVEVIELKIDRSCDRISADRNFNIRDLIGLYISIIKDTEKINELNKEIFSVIIRGNTSMQKEYHYYIVYEYEVLFDNGNSGMDQGSYDYLKRDTPITTFEDIDNISKQLQVLVNCNKPPKITFYTLLRVEKTEVLDKNTSSNEKEELIKRWTTLNNTANDLLEEHINVKTYYRIREKMDILENRLWEEYKYDIRGGENNEG